MLYDPKWDVKTDVFSLESLVAWLEKQPADKFYHWDEAGSCLLGQWCASLGLEWFEARNKSIDLGRWTNGNGNFAEIALGDLNQCTFGAALERARALAVSSPMSPTRAG